MLKRALVTAILIACFYLQGSASHITGGEMYYSYQGFLNGMYTYNVTLKLFQRCNSGRQFPDPAIIAVFENGTGNKVSELSVPLTFTRNLSVANSSPCISNPPTVCYDVAYYDFIVSVEPSVAGYTIASQVNYRIAGINNLSLGYSNVGATYSAEIPGTGVIASGPQNNSATFTGTDLVVVCANNQFNYSFAAHDDDGDQLHYSFCHAYSSTSGNNSPPNSPPYPSVPYNSPSYGGGNPLGNGVTIDPTTGLIRGRAPGDGIYVVTVCVEEIRGGKVIATQRKDLQINIANCSIAAASLQSEYLLCGHSKSIRVQNQSTSPLIQTYDWELISSGGTSLGHTTEPTFNYNFIDTGLYTIRLLINQNQLCFDSTQALIRVYPDFVAHFIADGICNNKPTSFTDQSSSVFGTVNSWSWDFGENTTGADTSSGQSPGYTYPSLGPKNVRLIATDTKGCRDTSGQIIVIVDKPPLLLAFSDTLICINDLVQLHSNATGIFNWSPPINLAGGNTPSPTVGPMASMTYYVDLNDNGCLGRDSVRVNVVDHVTLSAMNDTTICSGDTIRLRLISNGLQYAWTPGAQIIGPSIREPAVITTLNTDYMIIARIGGCSAQDHILVNAVPYPLADAGRDTTVCFLTPARLNASTDAASWHWSPEATLDDPASLHPVASPLGSTSYLLTVTDTKGCPKPTIDTIRVTMEPRMIPFAGRDTTVVTGQPLQLNASGGDSYFWTPADFLSAPDIPDPIGVFTTPSNGMHYKVVMVTEAGCIDSAYLTVKVFKTAPTIFVPTGFTPNGDGKNDLLRPVAAGISHFGYFRIYDRWGELVFSSTTDGQGWDGRVAGVLQPTGTFIWMVSGRDYNGNDYFAKGTVTLIR